MKTLSLKTLFAAFFTVALLLMLIFTLSACEAGDGTQAAGNLNINLVGESENGEPLIEMPDTSQTIPVDVIDQTAGVAKIVTQVLSEGEGTGVESGMSVQLDYTNYNMPGLVRDISTFDGGVPPTKMLVFAGDETPNSMSQVVIGHREGTVIAIATPGWKADSSALDTSGENYSLQIVKIVNVHEPVIKADGTPVASDTLDPNLPKVTLASDGTPSITIPASFLPGDEVVSEQLKIGDGDVVEGSDNVSFAYSAWSYDGDLIQTTWKEKVPFTASVDAQFTEAWKSVLVGKTLGSQFLIIAPPSSDSNSDQGLIYVVDLLEKN